jgi:hypothetical protein
MSTDILIGAGFPPREAPSAVPVFGNILIIKGKNTQD